MWTEIGWSVLSFDLGKRLCVSQHPSALTHHGSLDRSESLLKVLFRLMKLWGCVIYPIGLAGLPMYPKKMCEFYPKLASTLTLFISPCFPKLFWRNQLNRIDAKNFWTAGIHLNEKKPFPKDFVIVHGQHDSGSLNHVMMFLSQVISSTTWRWTKYWTEETDRPRAGGHERAKGEIQSWCIMGQLHVWCQNGSKETCTTRDRNYTGIQVSG